jgi:hypothetical protein
MTPYSARTKGTYTFDTELPPTRFWNKLKSYLNMKPELDEHKWRINFTVEDDLDD